MSFKKLVIWICTFLLIGVVMASDKADVAQAPTQAKPDLPKTADEVERITAEELKAKLAKNEPIMIIDVRATNSYLGSNSKIKGALFFKSRKIRARLAFPPLKNLPRDREIVTYCACPNDESSVRAAQTLLDAGFKRVRALKGGWQAWMKAGGQVELKPKLM